MSDSRDLPPEGSALELPPKPEVALALLQTAASVYVHLDPRGVDVRVPAWFKKQPQLVLQVGLNMAVAIPDLDVGEEALSCTLSFNRRPEYCVIPWTAIYGLVGDDGRGMVWPDSVPPEVAAAAEGRGTAKGAEPAKRALRAVGSERESAVADAGEPSARADEAGAALGDAPAADASPARKARASRKATTGERAPKARSPRRSAVSPENPPTPAAAEPAPPEKDQRAGASSSPKRPLPPYLRIVK